MSVTAEKAAGSVSNGQVADYYNYLAKSLCRVSVTDEDGTGLGQGEAVSTIIGWARATHAGGCKLMFVGNGGSAGICSHLAIDFSKNGSLRAMAFNDPSALTCLGNDLGYENVFAKQIEFHGRAGDLLVAISSSGRSPNILNAVKAARAANCKIITFSGFTEDNELRSGGDVNFFVRSKEYGFVEVAHLALCHAVLDIDMGWAKKSQ